MIEKQIEVTCPCCGQKIELFIEASGKVAARFYDIEADADITEILANSAIEFGVVCDDGCNANEEVK